jgi:hypothetical protein
MPKIPKWSKSVPAVSLYFVSFACQDYSLWPLRSADVIAQVPTESIIPQGHPCLMSNSYFQKSV